MTDVTTGESGASSKAFLASSPSASGSGSVLSTSPFSAHTIETPSFPSHLEKSLATAQSFPSCSDAEQGDWRAFWGRRGGWGGYLAEDIPTANFVPTLVLQALSAGVLDATTYADFSTFASNQTGNTILLTVSVVGTNALLKLTAISLGSFLGSAFVFGHLGHLMGVRRRSWLFLTTLFQSFLLFLCVILLSPIGPSPTSLDGPHDWFILCLFAILSGAQVAMARQSSCQEMPTAPMTSSYVDLMADKYLFVGWRHPKAGPRNRRGLYLGAMIAGGIIGAAVHKYAGSWVVVLITGVLKLGVLGMLAVAKGGETDCLAGP